MKIYVISRPRFQVAEVLQFLENENTNWRRTNGATDIEEIVEIAGRICYMSFGEAQSDRTNSEYIRNLILQGHESVLEHVSWSFIVTGVSRGFTHQLVRHRVGFSFSQLSQQYHDESDAKFVQPGIIEKYERLHAMWNDAVTQTKKSYNELIELMNKLELNDEISAKEIRRMKNSAARSVLPNATETKIFITANARAIRHFLTVRGSIPGDEEMRKAAVLIFQMVTKDSQSLFADFCVTSLNDDSPIIVKK